MACWEVASFPVHTLPYSHPPIPLFATSVAVEFSPLLFFPHCNCFLPHRADILAILVSSASLLPCISPPLTPLTVSAEVTTIHRSCAVLLASLAVVGCRLEQLQASLVQLNEASSDDLNVDQLWQWMEHLSLDHFGLVRHSSTAGTVLSDFTVLVCLPYPKWELLLKVPAV